MTDMSDYIIGYWTAESPYGEDGAEVWYGDAESITEDMLDEVCETVAIGNLSYDPGRVLREIDPVAFRETVLEQVNSWTEDGYFTEDAPDEGGEGIGDDDEDDTGE
jgi:hypothetical protein